MFNMHLAHSVLDAVYILTFVLCIIFDSPIGLGISLCALNFITIFMILNIFMSPLITYRVTLTGLLAVALSVASSFRRL